MDNDMAGDTVEKSAVSEALINRDKKKKKKRKHHHLGSDNSTRHDDGSNDHPRKKKKKKDMKVEEAGAAVAEPDVALEGHMVGDMMVLVDRSTGIVFSATERSENGQRKDIGRLSKLGSIELHMKQEEGKNMELF
eukprot:scaffold14691_cov143-Cylindrotheca_fusiformis.AAC.1